MFGTLRSLASQARHNDPSIDEEEFFKEISEAYIKGLKTEIAIIFGPTRAARLLDPFYGKTKRT